VSKPRTIAGRLYELQSLLRQAEARAHAADLDAAEWKARAERAEAALKRIAEHPHNAYPEGPHPHWSDLDRQYAVGVADGHRCAANVASEALLPAQPEGDS
jgi:hypothetical protein